MAKVSGQPLSFLLKNMVAGNALRFLAGLGWLLGAGWPAPGWGQAAAAAFVRYTTEQGLSQDAVTALARDQRGFLWVGTLNGLNRFDGVQFSVYKRTGRPEGLPGNYVVPDGITPDRHGYLWVATNRGLCRFDPVRERGLTVRLPQQFDHQADNDFVSPVHFDRAGQGWFAAVDRLYRIDPRTLRLTAFPLPYPASTYYPEPFFDAAGQLWLLSQSAVYRVDPATQRYTYCEGWDQLHPRATGGFQRLYASAGHGLYGLTPRGLRLYEPASGRFAPYARRHQEYSAMAESRGAEGQPVFWLGGPNQLVRYEPLRQRYTDFSHRAEDAHSYPGSTTTALMSDSLTGILWVGTLHGLAALDPNAHKFSWQLVPSASRLAPVEEVQTVWPAAPNDSLYWVLTRQTGLWRWQRPRGTVQPVGRPPGVPGTLYDALADAQGRIWVGLDGALGTYDPATKRWQVHRDFGLPPAGPRPARGAVAVRTLCLDQQRRLWLGTAQHGLFWYDPRQGRSRPYPLTLPPGPALGVRRMQADRRGRLWVLTTAGLFRVAADRQRGQLVQLRPLAPGVQLSDQLQSTFLLDHQGNIWLSGIDFLLQADSAGHVRRTYTLANGLRADHTFSLAEDRRGHLWLATDEQVHELDPATGAFRYYGKASGLLATGAPPPFAQNRQGELFLGAEGGFNYFQPTHLPRNLVPPPVAITEVRVNNLPRPAGTTAVVLRPGETTLTVAFAALNFSQAAKNRYAYQLLGFDPDWLTTDARTATYTNLAPGTYTLRIRAANNDGVWNQAGQTLAVRVRPAYYQTWWFRALLGAAGVALLWGTYRYRRAQRQQLARVRDRIAKDLHDDIGSTLSSIRIFSEVAQGQLAGGHPQTVALLQRISTNASTLAESMQDIIWTIKPSPDGLPDVVSRMREFGLRLTEAKGIAFVMSVEEPFPVLRLTLEQRRNLYLIFKESLNNAVKYAACTRLTVALSVRGRQLQLLVEDDGQGFDPATVRAGNGLANLRARARDIRGQVQVTSAPAAGTAVVLTALIS